MNDDANDLGVVGTILSGSHSNGLAKEIMRQNATDFHHTFYIKGLRSRNRRNGLKLPRDLSRI